MPYEDEYLAPRFVNLIVAVIVKDLSSSSEVYAHITVSLENLFRTLKVKSLKEGWNCGS